MHPQMPQQYLPQDFNLFSPVQSRTLPHPNQSFGQFNYEPHNYGHDPYANFDMSKPIEQFQYMPTQQQQQQQHQQPAQVQPQHQYHGPSAQTANQFNVPSYTAQNGYPQASRVNHRPSNSISSEDSLPTPNLNKQISLRAPKFDRTYTDALEDELYDESSSSASHSANSQAAMSRRAASNFGYQQRLPQFSNGVYMDKSMSAPSSSHSGARSQAQPSHSQQPKQQQQQEHLMNGANPSGNNGYSQPSPAYDPLANQSEAQRLSSTAVADSVRRLQAPDRTTVSPREAFLDYPDNADFRERTLFSKSASPYSQAYSHEAPENSGSRSHESESSGSNEDDYDGSEDHQFPMAPIQYPMTTNISTLAVPEPSRSASNSTYQSGIYSGDMSAESGASSESEYDPNATSTRRVSRSSGRPSVTSKTFACPDCGKRFEKAQPLQAHRRNSHGKAGGPPNLSQHKFSNTSHRCDYVDPNTGKTCNTVFSRP